MYSLNIILIVLVVLLVSTHARNTQIMTCTDDPFIHSEVTRSGKEFLYPWDHSQRNGDWYYNKGLCRKYGAVMVEILDAEENLVFHNFIREVGVVHPGAWLGAQIRDASPYFQWKNYANPKSPTYTNWRPGEPNEPGLTCMLVAWDTDPKNIWWNFLCNHKTMHVACQRYVNNCKGCASTKTAATHNALREYRNYGEGE